MGEALKTSTFILKLNLGIIFITSYIRLIITSVNNNIGEEGAKIIGDALRTNTSITELVLGG